MLRIDYPEGVIEKVRLIEQVAKTYGTGRHDAALDICGLTFNYLRLVGTRNKQPSNRTLMNLGYEVFLKDVATGEIIPVPMEVLCDWNTQNPRMNPTSIRISKDALREKLSMNELNPPTKVVSPIFTSSGEIMSHPAE